MFNLFGLFGKLGKCATGIVVAVGVFLLLRWGFLYYWARPEIWNGTAEGYQTHVGTLQQDSINKRLEIVNLSGVIVMKDSTIAKKNRDINKLTDEANKSLAFGNEWKGKFKTAVMASDANTNLLTDKERELAYYKILVKNGSLSQAKVPTLTDFKADSPIVITAGLKTANQLQISTASLDTLSKTVGYLQAANQRLGAGLSTASSGLASLSQKAQANQKGGIPFIRHRRVKQNKAMQKTADSLKAIVDQVSDLEKIYNKRYEN